LEARNSLTKKSAEKKKLIESSDEIVEITEQAREALKSGKKFTENRHIWLIGGYILA